VEVDSSEKAGQPQHVITAEGARSAEKFYADLTGSFVLIVALENLITKMIQNAKRL